MPVYNEIGTVQEIIRRVQAVDIEKEIIVVDDGSTDGTRTVLQQFQDQQIKVLFHGTNRGKGAAIRTALEHVTGDLVIIQDADLEYDPQDYAALLQPFSMPEVSVVYGSRNLLPTNRRSSLAFYWGGVFLSWLANLLYGARITDEATGYKAFRREVLEKISLECQGFEFCAEVTAKICRAGYRIVEVPIRYSPRSVREGKKISSKDGFVAIYTLLKYRWLK